MKNITLEHEAYNFLQSFYLTWVNDFISYEGIANYYGISTEEAQAMIELGRKNHERMVKECAA